MLILELLFLESAIVEVKFYFVVYCNLWFKLSNIRILKLLTDCAFLTNRSPQVQVGYALPDTVSIMSGVSGFVLGPALFIWITGDLRNLLGDKDNIKLFADNFKLYSEINIQNSSTLLQHSIDWFKNMVVLIKNCLKSQYLHLRSKLFIPDFHADDEFIPRLNQICDLLVTTYSYLRFISHISIIASRALSMFALVLRYYYYHNMAL